MIRRGGPGRALVLLAAAAAVGTGCSRAERTASTAPASALRVGGDAGPVLDVQTMAFLSKARALHHEANLREEAGDLPGAVAQVERIIDAVRPHPTLAVPEVEEVLADAWARVAELDVRLGDSKGRKTPRRRGSPMQRERRTSEGTS